MCLWSVSSIGAFQRAHWTRELTGDLIWACQELADFGRRLFDHRGRLRSTYAVPGAVRAGTGLWGHELSAGSLACEYGSPLFKRAAPSDASSSLLGLCFSFAHKVVLEIVVRPPFRSQGIEETALDLLVQYLAGEPSESSRDCLWSPPTALFYLPAAEPNEISDIISSSRPVRYDACMNGSGWNDFGHPCCPSLSGRGKNDQHRMPDLLTNVRSSTSFVIKMPC
jgi:hypothetical protein